MSSHPFSSLPAASALPGHLGPVVVAAKGHSGSRFIAEALQEAGVFMGADMNAAFDSLSWHDDFAVPLMNSRWHPLWPREDPEFAAFVGQRLADTVRRYTGGRTVTGPWGWKGSTLFVTDLVIDVFPGTRLLHLIRDGRDVALSQDGRLNLPLQFPLDRRNPVKRAKQFVEGVRGRRSRDDYRMKIFFGRSDLREWNGVELTRRSIDDNRYLLQMQSWIRNVTEARRHGERLGDRYREIRYEQLCREPRAVMSGVLEWLGLPVTDDALSFVDRAARTSSIGKWREMDMAPDRRRDLERACAHGRELLEELGYPVE